MHSPVMDQQRARSGGGDKDAHNRETLQTTGFYGGRIVIVTREFAPIPHTPAGLPIPMAIRMRFLRHDGIYRSDVVQTKTKPWGGTEPPPDGRPRAQAKERAGRITPFSSSAMSSGRLFLDRVACQHCPSPLHRHGQENFDCPIRRNGLSSSGKQCLNCLCHSRGQAQSGLLILRRRASMSFLARSVRILAKAARGPATARLATDLWSSSRSC
jgi:hypothetical protein